MEPRRARAIALALSAVSMAQGAFAASDAGPPAAAQDPPAPDATLSPTPADKEHAKALYEQGVTAYREQKYGDALDALLASAKLFPSPLLYFNISLVYEAMGDAASALAWLRRYVRETGGVADGEAARRITALEAQLQRDGVQQLSVFSTPEGGLVHIDGRAIGIAPVTTQLIPGNHQVKITLAGYDSAEQVVELRADKSMDVRISLSPRPDAVAAKAAPPVAATEPRRTRLARRDLGKKGDGRAGPSVGVLTIATLGAGASALGAALGFELHRASLETDARRASQVDYAARVHDMETAQTWSRVFLGVGAALVVAGGIELGFDLQGGGAPKRASVSSCGYAGICGAAQGEFW